MIKTASWFAVGSDPGGWLGGWVVGWMGGWLGGWVGGWVGGCGGGGGGRIDITISSYQYRDPPPVKYKNVSRSSYIPLVPHICVSERRQHWLR